jgi:hypothetical protein
MLKNPAGYEKHFVGKIYTICLQVSPDSLLGVSAGICQKVLLDESEMIRTRTGTKNRSKMIAMHGTLFKIHPITVTSNIHSELNPKNKIN